MKGATVQLFIHTDESDTDEHMSTSSTVAHTIFDKPIERESEREHLGKTDGTTDTINEANDREKIELSDEGIIQLEIRLKELRKRIAQERNIKTVTHIVTAEGIKHLVRITEMIS